VRPLRTLAALAILALGLTWGVHFACAGDDGGGSGAVPNAGSYDDSLTVGGPSIPDADARKMSDAEINAMLARLRNGDADGPQIQPHTPQATQTIAELRRASKLDRLNAQSYRGGEYNKAATYLTDKANSADELAAKLSSGQAVAEADVKKALDTSRLVGLGGY